MEFQASIETIAKLCRRIIGTSGRHLGRAERHIAGGSVFMPFFAYQNVDAEHPIGKLGHLLPVGVPRRRESRIVTSL
jgi:hypothetical protein